MVNPGIDCAPADSNQPAGEEQVAGYAHPLYCESFGEFGRPRFLTECGGWLLERPIPNSDYSDAMGCYPLFACQDWSRLDFDLDRIENSLVSVALVTDPFGDYDHAYLRQCFPDLAVPFKDHFVVDLGRDPKNFIHSHHRRNAQRARREMRVEKCDSPSDFLEDWIVLYQTLVVRHRITGMTAFSRESFKKQLQVPGLVMFRAVNADKTIGMLLWYAQRNRAYYHLGAYSPAGYDRRASFALFDYSIEYFASHGLKWLNLGAGAGSSAGATSGLNRFKRGWSTGIRTAYFCGRVINPQKYQALAEATGAGTATYFPAYRVGEFS